jgi:hypothetical protein
VLNRNGIEPAPERGKRTRWSTFLKAHWKGFAASDFFSVEVWTPSGLVTHCVLFVIGLADRIVHLAGITTRPGEAWMLQIGRSLTDEGGALAGKRYLIIDRDTKYSERFRKLVEEGATEVIRLPGVAASSDKRAYGPLSRGAQSSRAGKPGDPAATQVCREWRRCPSASTPRWHAELLLPRCGVRASTEFLDITGTNSATLAPRRETRLINRTKSVFI